ncbi:hypothetical protein SELSPUOL_00359 [Selenomonas sputigena ATCC 35185]|uniref:Uncharacterized protein n=1 Tax=Selenomonas sputigena (strain ATCC 35185 / DSM 20758 / CCUG 44933 / VPI D19B-28) TaxID=546271 RepID=C9LSD4_SELS3|nr:hypothetical protein SELSPUOL_00359 [Selenomonas sputigena ATCC 35185]
MRITFSIKYFPPFTHYIENNIFCHQYFLTYMHQEVLSPWVQKKKTGCP